MAAARRHGSATIGMVHERSQEIVSLVFRHLERHYKLTVVKVGRAIRQKLNHGQSPDRGGSRTDAFYIGCLSNSANKTMGFVAFPGEIRIWIIR